MSKSVAIDRKQEMDFREIPTEIHNIQISEQDRKRMAEGLPSSLIHDIQLEDGEIMDAKLYAYKNDKGGIDIGYDEKEQSLRIPRKIFDQVLTSEQKNLLSDGKMLGPLVYKGEEFYVGVDEQLNKVTVKGNKELGIPEEIGNYKLDGVDKHYLANGRSTDKRLFQSPDGDFFSAKLNITEDKKGFEFTEIKSVQKENADRVREKLNKDKTITDRSRRLNMVSLPVAKTDSTKQIETAQLSSNTTKVVSTKIDPLEKILPIGVLRNKTKKVNSNKHIEYDSATNTKTGFKINSKTFVPEFIKGVRLTQKQMDKLRNLEPVLLKGMKFKSGKHDALVQLGSSGINFDFNGAKKTNNNKFHSKDKGRSFDLDDDKTK